MNCNPVTECAAEALNFGISELACSAAKLLSMLQSCCLCCAVLSHIAAAVCVCCNLGNPSTLFWAVAVLVHYVYDGFAAIATLQSTVVHACRVCLIELFWQKCITLLVVLRHDAHGVASAFCSQSEFKSSESLCMYGGPVNLLSCPCMCAGPLSLLSCLAEQHDTRSHMLQAGVLSALVQLVNKTHDECARAGATSLLRLLTHSTDRQSTDRQSTDSLQ